MASYVFKDSDENYTCETGSEIGEGEITIEKYDAANKKVSGSFKFNAFNKDTKSLTNPVVSFREGHFYNVSVK